jgi:hypothetical protein
MKHYRSVFPFGCACRLDWLPVSPTKLNELHNRLPTITPDTIAAAQLFIAGGCSHRDIATMNEIIAGVDRGSRKVAYR